MVDPRPYAAADAAGHDAADDGGGHDPSMWDHG
jgi:hypothetical protein